MLLLEYEIFSVSQFVDDKELGMTRTLIACLPWLIQIRFGVPRKFYDGSKEQIFTHILGKLSYFMKKKKKKKKNASSKGF